MSNPIIDKIAELKSYTGLDESKDKKTNKEKQKARIESRLNEIQSDMGDLNTNEVAKLRSEAGMLDKLADYADNLANQLDKKQHQQLQKKNLEEVKKALMEQLGIPSEFVDQLSMLVKAGPEALREGAAVYRTEAKRRREDADYSLIQIQKYEKEITELKQLKNAVISQNNEKSHDQTDYINQKIYELMLRSDAEMELKDALEAMEGRETAKV